MGHKVNPVGLRLGVNRTWDSRWYASRGEYGVPEGLQFSYPVRSDGRSWTIVEGIEHDDFARRKLDATIAELVEEHDEVRELLGS